MKRNKRSGNRIDIEEFEIRSLGELIDHVTPIERDPASGRLRDASIFRGVPHDETALLTSLDQLGGTTPPHTKAHLEEHLLRNFIRYASPFTQNRNLSLWELLILAQHHGLPTRLLDWTSSPFVAAHFAMRQSSQRGDRFIWRLNWRQVHEHFRLRSVAFLVQDLDEVVRARSFASLWEFFQADADENNTFACMLEPPALDQRIVAQAAAFTLSSNKRISLDELLRQCGLTSALTRLIIPSEKVECLRDQLDLCGVDERRLFPDLDGVTAILRRYYS
jgi:hypothetical protein